jgi:hypothetical protein
VARRQGAEHGGIVSEVDLTGPWARIGSGQQNSDTIHNRIFSTDRSPVGGGLPCWRGHKGI